MTGVEIDVARVLDGSSGGESVAENEARETMIGELGRFAEFPALDVAIEDSGGADLQIERRVRSSVLTCGFVLVCEVFLICGIDGGVLNHDGGVLTTIRRVGGDIDDKLGVDGLTRVKTINGFWKAEPILEVGIGTVG